MSDRMTTRQAGFLTLMCFAAMLLFLAWSCGGNGDTLPRGILTAEENAYFVAAEDCLGFHDAIPPVVRYEPVHQCANGVWCCVIDDPEGSAYCVHDSNLVVIGIPVEQDHDYCKAWIDKHALRNEFCNAVSAQMGISEDCWCRSHCGACA